VSTRRSYVHCGADPDSPSGRVPGWRRKHSLYVTTSVSHSHAVNTW
jgi:hypothetical protein